MMSQQRTRKAGGVAIHPVRGRQSVVRASGDSMAVNNNQNKQPNVRSTSKSKIPKSLRYDVENALVSLCDVWFEEIKPHLVRNNIKVHVHVHGEGAGPASGDHRRLPPGEPGCSHLDPGAAPDLYQQASASCADYCSTQPTALKARSRRPRPSRCQASPLPVSSPAKLRASLLIPCRNCEVKIPQDSHTRRSLWPTQSQQSRNWRTPRLCRTYSILTPGATPPARRSHTADPQMTRRTGTKRQPKKVDKATQTPVLRRPEILPWQEESWQDQHLRHELSKQDQLRQLLLKQDMLRLELNKQDLLRQEQNKQEPCSLKVQEPSKQKTTSCLRCPATTNMRGCKQVLPIVPLFQEDLINIIAEKNDKQLRLLFKSPTREDQASSMNLAQSQPPKPVVGSKKIPWR